MKGRDHLFTLDERVALITGATGGIGSEMARLFAGAGASVVLASDDEATCRALADRIIDEGGAALAHPIDVRSKTALDALVDAAIVRFGRIDVLVCNAGIAGPHKPLHEVDEEEWANVLAVNFDHARRLCCRIAPLMAECGSGSIVLTSSLAALRGNARIGAYALTKAALTQLARNLAVEWGPSNVRANALAPGLIGTSWAGAIMSNPDASASRLKATPLRRVGEPWEVAAAALFLASPAAGFITGHTLVVDGGTLISDGN